jgi:hypothetical protein
MKKEDIKKILEQADNLLGKKTDKQIQQYVSEGHKIQNKQRASKGGIATLRGKGYTDIQKKGNKIAFEKGVGIHNKENVNYKKWKSKAGKVGAKSQMKNGLGIHVDSETRKEWSRLGGLKSIANLNRERQCPYCGIKTKGAAYNRWHGEKCKHK